MPQASIVRPYTRLILFLLSSGRHFSGHTSTSGACSSARHTGAFTHGRLSHWWCCMTVRLGCEQLTKPGRKGAYSASKGNRTAACCVICIPMLPPCSPGCRRG